MGLGIFVALHAGNAFDAGAGYPLGKTDGFMSFGVLTLLSVVGGTSMGTALGALVGHGLLEGEGGFWAALLGALLGLGGVAALGMSATVFVLPSLALLPLFAATGLELAAGDS